MIDEAKLEELKYRQASVQQGHHTNQSAPVTLREQLKAMPEKDLRTLQALLNELLPEQSVKELNLEDELMQQYRKTKGLMDEISGDADTPANQKAQVANSVVGTLAQLVKLQEDLKLQEAMKLMETTLIDAIKTLPQETKNEFFEVYEIQAKRAGLI